MKLNQTIAIEKGVKSRVYSEITEMHKAAQKPALFNGFMKIYRKKEEEGEDYPPERMKVQHAVPEFLTRLQALLSELFDTTATKDWGNCEALADIRLDNTVYISRVPATYLLFLEKQLTDIHTFVEKLPVLDEAEDWQWDEHAGVFKTQPITTHRTKKIQKPIVMYEATKEHPAQTQIITEDILVGHWDTIKHSGAMPAPRRQQLLERVETLMKAVKVAREEANMTDVMRHEVGKLLFQWLFI